MEVPQQPILLAITIVVMAAIRTHLVTTQATILKLDTIQATPMELGITATRTQQGTTPIMELGITATRAQQGTTPIMELGITATRTQQGTTPIMELGITATRTEPGTTPMRTQATKTLMLLEMRTQATKTLMLLEMRTQMAIPRGHTHILRQR